MRRKRLAAGFLAWGLLAALIAPTGLLAQEPPPAPAPPPPAAQATAPTTSSTEPGQPAPSPPPPPKPEPAPVAVASGPGSVRMKNIAFSPSSITVNVGDSVTWTNGDQVVHDVTANDSSFELGNVKPGASVSHTFTKAGTFGYICTIHPGMTGTVKVVASSSGGGGGSNGGTQGGTSSGGGSTTGSSSTAAAPSRSRGSLPATGMDAGGLALLGAGFLALGLFARRRTAS